MLNILETKPGAPLDLRFKIEAQKLSVMGLGRYVTNPKFASIPTEGLLSKAYAAERGRRIDPSRAQGAVRAGEPGKLKNPIYLAVVDRGGLFDTDPQHVNRAAPHKRPLHAIIQGLPMHGDSRVAFGILGGVDQAQAHAQFVSCVVDQKMKIQEAMESPRFTRREPEGCGVQIENRFPAPELDRLRKLGHQLDVRAAHSSRMGGGQAVFDRKTKVKSGASDPRKDGAAAPEPESF
jgi:gamma-glutamyltranspeptidase/glutathione hydrolase